MMIVLLCKAFNKDSNDIYSDPNEQCLRTVNGNQ